MTPEDKERQSKRLKREISRIREKISDYENAVSLVSSLQQWFEYRWGIGGRVVPGRLLSFERFTLWENGLRPDFVARFKTPYVLCGECKKTFPSGNGRRKDALQVAAYSRRKLQAKPGEPTPNYDVLLLVDTDSDDAAASALNDLKKDAPNLAPVAPIVILGYRLTEERIRHWFSVKWRRHDGMNSRFSEPNVVDQPDQEDLNKLIVEPTRHSIPLDLHALDLTDRVPFINDDPPPLYTLRRVLIPALNELLTDDQRDTLATSGRIDMSLTYDVITKVPLLRGRRFPERYIRDALGYLVKVGWARCDEKAKPPRYIFRCDLRMIQGNLTELLTKKEARMVLSPLRRRRRQRAGTQQLEIPFDTDTPYR